MTRKADDTRSIAESLDARRHEEMARGLAVAIRGTEEVFRPLDGIVQGMRGDVRRRDGSAARRPITGRIDAVKKAWTASARAGNLRGGNAVESGTGARRIGRTNTSPEAPPPIRACRRRSTGTKEEGSWVG